MCNSAGGSNVDLHYGFFCLLQKGGISQIKGAFEVKERAEARHKGFMQNVELRRVAEYPMPGTDSNSVILQLSAKRQVLEEVVEE